MSQRMAPPRGRVQAPSRLVPCPSNCGNRSLETTEAPSCRALDLPWPRILDFLDGKSTARVGACCKFLSAIVSEDATWRSVVMRQFKIKEAPAAGCSWKQIYLSVNGGTHSFSSFQADKHLDWMRIGGFVVSSGSILATDSLDLQPPLFSPDGDLPSRKRSTQPELARSWEIPEVQNTLFVADLHLVRCPVCNLTSCEGTMQVLEARSVELFLCPEWEDGTWTYDKIGGHDIPFHCPQAKGAILDSTAMNMAETQGIFAAKWVAGRGDWQPRGIHLQSAVAACTNLQPNEGLRVSCSVLRGSNGLAMGIRISHQLL